MSFAGQNPRSEARKFRSRMLAPSNFFGGRPKPPRPWAPRLCSVHLCPFRRVCFAGKRASHGVTNLIIGVKFAHFVVNHFDLNDKVSGGEHFVANHTNRVHCVDRAQIFFCVPVALVAKVAVVFFDFVAFHFFPFRFLSYKSDSTRWKLKMQFIYTARYQAVTF